MLPRVRCAEDGEQVAKSVRQCGGGGGEVALLRVNDNTGRGVDFTRFLIGNLNSLSKHVSDMQWFIKVFIYLVGGLHGVIQRHLAIHSVSVEEMGYGVGTVRREIVAVCYGQFVVSHDYCCLSL